MQVGLDKNKPMEQLFAEVYRAEPCAVVSGSVFLPSSSIRAIDATGAPVSMAVELATLVISALRNLSGSRRYGLVSISGFCSMGIL